MKIRLKKPNDIWIYTSIIMIIIFTGSIFTKGYGLTNGISMNSINPNAPTLELYVMSQCPYGVQAENMMAEILNTFSGEINFELHFIADIYSENEWNSLPQQHKQYYEQYGMCYEKNNEHYCSLHGPTEFNENLRQLCAMKYYPNTYYDYILCINQDYRNLESIWEECAAQTGLNPETLRTCSTSNEGINLLKTNLEKTNQREAGGSPTIYINNQKYQGSRTANAIQQAICNITSNLKGCSQQLNSNTQAVQGGC